MALSKEEKKALKEAKRLEKLKAEAEMKKQLKQDEMQREMAAQALKRKELENTWRGLMLKIKEPVFRQDMEVIWHIFERSFDKKDHLIKYNMKLMDIADEQFQRTISSFCVTIDTMVSKFLEDLNYLSKDNSYKTGNLLKSGEDNVMSLVKHHSNAETHLQLLLYHGHSTADTLAWTTRGDNLVKEDEDRIKYNHQLENLRSFLEDRYNSVWEEYKAVVKSYISEIGNNQKQVRKLRRKENLMADIIASQGKKIANSDDLVKKLRTELAAYESGTKQAVFRDRRNRHRAACHKLKKRMMNGCATDVKKMALLVTISDSAVNCLESAAKKGEKILRMAALCRKYEIRREKIMPYGSDAPHSPIKAVGSLRLTKSDDSLVANAITTTCGLTRLWHRISKAELTRRALYQEKILLKRENSYIMQKIEEFKANKISPETFECICSDTQNKGANSLLVAVDGVLEMSKYRKM